MLRSLFLVIRKRIVTDCIWVGFFSSEVGHEKLIILICWQKNESHNSRAGRETI